MAKYQITKKSQSCILKRYAALRFLLYAVIPSLSSNYPLERLTHVLLCLDCDDYDIKGQDLEFINTAEEYCIQKTRVILLKY